MADLPYDPTTPLGQARFHAADTSGPGQYTFSDPELTYALGACSGDPISAAAMALQALANDQARLAVILKTEKTSTDVTELSDKLAARAADLRMQAGLGGVIDAPDRVFSTNDSSTATIGSMTGW